MLAGFPAPPTIVECPGRAMLGYSPIAQSPIAQSAYVHVICVHMHACTHAIMYTEGMQACTMPACLPAHPATLPSVHLSIRLCLGLSSYRPTFPPVHPAIRLRPACLTRSMRRRDSWPAAKLPFWLTQKGTAGIRAVSVMLAIRLLPFLL